MNLYRQKWALWIRPVRSWAKNAVTLGQTTFYSCTEGEVDAEWRRHEDEHKKQWARDGAFNFIVKYLYEAARYGYENISYEVEARAAEKQAERGI